MSATEHVLVETVGPWEGGGDAFVRGARALADTGVTLVLLDDAVAFVRTDPGLLADLAGDGVRVLVDRVGLNRRALGEAPMPPAVLPADATDVARAMLSVRRVVWH